MKGPLNGPANGDVKSENPQTENPAVGVYLLIIS